MEEQLLNRRVSALEQHDFDTKTLTLLGVDGMSSDDSDRDEDGTVCSYIIRRVPWRSDELSDWLRQIDNVPTTTTLGRKGKHRLPRLNTGTNTSTRKAPNGLPKSFYNDEWSAKLDTKPAVTFPSITYFA